MAGVVYIIGAGPGDPDLLTLKAFKVIQKADVIFYDRLVSSEILGYSSSSCIKHFVGKKETCHFVTQDETNDLLVEAAKKYDVVVRLKGGDPFVFGRGSEEMDELKRAGVECQAIPGISSALAAPAYAGIPLTHRHMARSFTVVTGHLAKDDAQNINWKDYAKVDTLVILMGVRRRSEISKELIESGRNPKELVAFVENGTTPLQNVVVSSLEEVAGGKVEVCSPAIMIVGEVVSIRPKMDWFLKSKINKVVHQQNELSCIF